MGEDIIEEVIDSAIDEAKEIFENESIDSLEDSLFVEEESSTEEIPEEPAKEPVAIGGIDANSDEAFNEVNELDQEAEEETTETSEPSKDIDLGSVQEV